MKLEIFLDKAKKPRIRLRASNGKILMSSEAYSSKNKAWQTAERISHVTFEKRFTVIDLTEKPSVNVVRKLMSSKELLDRNMKKGKE